MDNKFLNTLKEDIVNELSPLTIDKDLDPLERFNFYLTIASSTHQEKAFKEAFESAKLIKDSALKANSFMRLLDLVSEIQELDYSEEPSESEDKE